LDHFDRLRVVTDHPLHELHVGGRVADLRQIDGFGRSDDAAGLSGSSGLHDGWLRLSGPGAAGGGGYGEKHHGEPVRRSGQAPKGYT
jgi:hypothetical protein